jgi:hypothetical protein
VTLTRGRSGVVRCDSADVNAGVWHEGRWHCLWLSGRIVTWYLGGGRRVRLCLVMQSFFELEVQGLGEAICSLGEL